MNLSLSKSRHQVSDFNEKIVGLSSKQGFCSSLSPCTWGQVPIWGEQFQFDEDGEEEDRMTSLPFGMD